MSFANVRRTLFTVHMWVGLILGVLLAALGLSGSLLVYDDQIANLIAPPPHATTAGQPLPLTVIQDSARQTAEAKGVYGQMQIVLPDEPGRAISVRMGGLSPMGNMPGMGQDNGPRREGGRRHRRDGASPPGAVAAGSGDPRANQLQIFIDPVSGTVLSTRKALLPPILTFAHQLHGNFFMGRDGRTWAVGPLGVAMLILGVTGLVLWWPKRGQWKYAFIVRRTAKGLRFHRELHAAAGIWIFVVFMAVSFSGIVIAWPQTFGMPAGGRGPNLSVEEQAGKTLGATEAAIAALKALPGGELRSITIPARPGQAIAVNLLSHGAINATVMLNPYTGEVMQLRDPSSNWAAWQRPVHQGSLGPIWKFLVFLSGLVPTLFVITGIIMWAKKRKRHVPMTMLADDVAGEEPA